MSSKTTPVKVGVAGLGRSGWDIHAKALTYLPGYFTVNAVCDPDSQRQQEAVIQFECRTYANFNELLADEDVELAIIATPSHHHSDHAMAAMRAGKHVLVEKPMAPTLAEADKMIQTAKETGRILTVNQNYRYGSNFLKIKEIIESGVLGQILQIKIAVHQFSRRWDWQTLKKYGGGILNNHGAHYVDCALQLINDPEPEVFCNMETTPLCTGDAESHVKLIMKPKTGPLVDIELTHACAYPQQQYLVMGTQGSLSSDRKTIRWSYFDPATAPPLILDTSPPPDRSYNSETLPLQEETFTPQIDLIGDVQNLYKDLYATIRDGAPLTITPESVRSQIAILEKCRALSPIYTER